MTASSTLGRWLRRAQPSPRALVKALLNGAVASVANVALLVGAVGLLVESAHRPGLRAVAVALVAIELVAFARSPLRFAERMSGHRLGYDAVTTWRRWLVRRVGALDYARWRHFALGDVLERSLRDTDELQSLWLRGVIPLIDTSVVLLLGDVIVALLAPRGAWWPVALELLIVQVLAVGALWLVTREALRRDRVLRRARARYRAELLELGAVTPELSLLGREDEARARLARVERPLAHAEGRARRTRLGTGLVVALAGALSVTALIEHPRAAPLWSVVVAAYCVTILESLNVLRAGFEALVAVSGGAERLEALDDGRSRGAARWSGDVVLSVESLTVAEDDRVLVADLTFSLPPGRRVAVTGASGTGKSTLLRTLAGLDAPRSGYVRFGGVDVCELDEGELRAHLAYVPSEPGFSRGYAVDVATLGRGDASAALALLERLGLRATPDTWFDDLSRGELARVAIVRALVTRPRVVILDEPTAGLGTRETTFVLDVLADLGVSVVVATHDPLVREWCDDVVSLNQPA
ncbi:MAG: ATP-binding cassette domain-containing protein [Acidobacteriota bacterium]|nr:ATP-binding cassette domain-containing protein [Acidobacteriota bacterium]